MLLLNLYKILMIRKVFFCSLFLLFFCCNEQKKEPLPATAEPAQQTISYAKGFSISKEGNDITLITVSSPWSGATTKYTYALIPKEKMAFMTLNSDAYDAIVSVPVERMVATSTTHIPALEELGVIDKLVGFPDTQYVSSPAARQRIRSGKIVDLGKAEAINSEMTLALNPEVIVGFSVSGQNKAYETLKHSNLPVVYNGDWTEESPLGKAEWIKFFAPFFQLETKADSIYKQIETSYNQAKDLAKKATKRPTVMSGALYKDIWYLPGGKSWAAQFLKDANSKYLWSETEATGSLSLGWENVLETAQNAEFWVSPSQFTSYDDMSKSSRHHEQFKAFQSKKIFTFAKTKGMTGGLLYYELAPQRPDLVLKDLIHIFHKGILPEHEPYFFKPLDN